MDVSLSIGRSAYVNTVLTAAVVAAIGFAAYGNHFIQDDGFISLRYADHWVRGSGPVWYPGSTEFGYTNFLFMALCAALMAAGVGPVLAASIVSYSGFAIAVLAAYAIVFRLTRDPKIAALCILVIFTNFTVSSYASGLLETALQAGLVLVTYWGVIRYAQEPSEWLPFVIALAASLALLTRLDSSLLLLPAGVYALWHLKSSRHLIVFLAVPTLIVGGFLVFCYLQYGQVLPNTFYAKVGGPEVASGIRYVKLFLHIDNFQYAIFSVALLAIYIATKNAPHAGKLAEASLFLAAVTLWTAYIVYIGGGFMGFRLMVPVIVFFVMAFFVLAAPFRLYGLFICLAVYAVATSFTHRQLFLTAQAYYGSGVEHPARLHRHVSRPITNWAATGKQLNMLFYTGSPGDVSIAVRAAGAIPFYARLPTIDMFGLNDRWVAVNGALFSNRAGHRRIAPFVYLKKRGVNLIIGHPTYICEGDRANSSYQNLPTLLIPIGGKCSLVAFYNARHPRVEALIVRGVIKRRSHNGAIE